jgi:hypothetical protein
MAAVGANTGIEFQVFEINDLTTFRTFAPKTIAFIGFLLDVGDVLTLAAISKPIEQRHTRPSAPTIKSCPGQDLENGSKQNRPHTPAQRRDQ